MSSDTDLDIAAYRNAARRAEASTLVAEERLVGAVETLHAERHSIREIATRLDVTRSRVFRILATGGHPTILTIRREELHSREDTHAEYDAAHNAAWAHFPPTRD